MNEPNIANQVAQSYINAWNETDDQKRRELIAQVWTENATYLDPMMQGQGHTNIDALIQGVHAQFPGHRFRCAGKIEQVGHFVRFSWHLAPEQSDALVGGTDFCTLSLDGRLQSVTGFLDFAPGLPAKENE